MTWITIRIFAIKLHLLVDSLSHDRQKNFNDLFVRQSSSSPSHVNHLQIFRIEHNAKSAEML
jgi:hypothetical protein